LSDEQKGGFIDMKEHTGLSHIYYGDGQGKTTAAFGLAFRCTGCGYRVVIAQFLKSRKTGEVTAAERFQEIRVLRSHPLTKFTFQMNDEERVEVAKNCETLFEDAVALTSDGSVRLLVLDEVIDACAYGLLPMERLMRFLAARPTGLEVAMTGHSLPVELAELADYVSEIKAQKHPYEKGINARHGIEY